MKIYLAGPMSGYDDYNYPAFWAAEQALKAQGHEVFSPARKDCDIYELPFETAADAAASGWKMVHEIGSKFSRRHALSIDLSWICLNADAIAVLPNWGDSTGVAAEIAAGEAIEAPIYFLGMAELPGGTYQIADLESIDA